MPTSPLKRPSGGGGGRLRRLLASLRPPARAARPLPVQTGFPTSIADIVVKNHGRLRNPRRRHRAAVPPPAAASAAAAGAAPVSEQRRELSVSVAHDAAPPTLVPVTARPGHGHGAGGFSIRPGLLAAGGAVALALLVIWSKQLVAAATIASMALSWIEYARTVRDRRREIGGVSPVREAAASPRSTPSCCDGDADDDDTVDLGRDVSPSPASSPKRKQRRRSLRKLLAGKLRNGKTPRGMDSDSRHGGDAGQRPETPRTASRPDAEPAAPAEEMPTPAVPQEAITDATDDDLCRRRRGGALPLPALVPIILAGLVAGKLPALALAVLCAAFSSSVERVAVPAGQQASR